MQSKVLFLSLAALVACEAFTVPSGANTAAVWGSKTHLFSEKETAGAFVPPEVPEEGKTESDDDTFAKVENFGRGAAKIKRGKRKGSSVAPSQKPAEKTTLVPEETYYEGPPAITETIIPTVSILTVVGIIPAAAAWARQAWVRYKITNRRIRVQSGFGGNDMAEIVYPDIVEIRTAKRLLGDGDLVVFLRDGARFEMRNIPKFDETMEYILGQVDEDVVEMYKKDGDVTQP